MDRFSKLHPLMQFSFFIFSILLVLIANNPVISAISLVCSIIYGAKIRGKEIFSSLKFTIAILVTVSVFNMLFAHYGESVLFIIGNTKFTLQALLYGFNQGMVLSAVMLWFSAFSRTVDSEKIIYLFRFTPKIALLFSMVLGFIPRFTKKLEDIRDARLALNGGKADETFSERLKSGIEALLTLVSYSLEASIITAQSMEAREYNPKAIRPSRYKIMKTDALLFAIVLLLGVYVFVQIISKNLLFIFEPTIYIESLDVLAVVCFIALELLPIVVDLVEDALWKLSNAKN